MRMLPKGWVLAFFALVLVACSGQTRQHGTGPSPQTDFNIDQVCQQTKCRNPLTVKVAQGEGYFEEQIPKAPYVYGGQVSIVAGETLYISAKEDGGKLVGMAVVENVDQQEKAIALEFRQLADHSGRPMLLIVKNPYKKHLKYRGFIHPAGKKAFYSTSLCPVIPGGRVFEEWPNPIIQLLLTDFHLVDEETRLICE